MYRIKISRHNGITNTFSWILDNGQLRDRAADIPKEHYEEIAQAAHASEYMQDSLEIDNTRYSWVLSAMHTVTIVDPTCSVKFEFRNGKIVCTDNAGCDLDHIFRDVDIAAIDKMSADEVRALVLEKWSEGYDGDPDNIEITVE